MTTTYIEPTTSRKTLYYYLSFLYIMVRSTMFPLSERHEITSIAIPVPTLDQTRVNSLTATSNDFRVFPYFISNKANAPYTFAEHAHL